MLGGPLPTCSAASLASPLSLPLMPPTTMQSRYVHVASRHADCLLIRYRLSAILPLVSSWPLRLSALWSIRTQGLCKLPLPVSSCSLWSQYVLCLVLQTPISNMLTDHMDLLLRFSSSSDSQTLRWRLRASQGSQRLSYHQQLEQLPPTWDNCVATTTDVHFCTAQWLRDLHSSIWLSWWNNGLAK